VLRVTSDSFTSEEGGGKGTTSLSEGGEGKTEVSIWLKDERDNTPKVIDGGADIYYNSI